MAIASLKDLKQFKSLACDMYIVALHCVDRANLIVYLHTKMRIIEFFVTQDCQKIRRPQ
jgi:hypothetical protein